MNQLQTLTRIAIISLFYIGTAYSEQAKVAVIGGGMAGLSTAFTISKGADGKQTGWKVDVFEATNRLGGRVWSGELCTNVNNSKQCQTMEYGGELIDSGHLTVLNYAQMFGLTIEDRIGCKRPNGFSSISLKCSQTASKNSPTGYVDENGNTLPFTEPVNSVLDGTNSVIYTATEAQNDWFLPGAPVNAVDFITKDTQLAKYPTTFYKYNTYGETLDKTNLNEYLQNLEDKGVSNKFIQLLRVAYVGEFGLEPNEESTLDLLYLLGYSARKPLQIFGESDERYHIAGGNEQIITHLKNEILSLPNNNIHLNNRLIKVEHLANGKYRLTFDHPMTKNNTQKDVYIYDRIVLAIPFSVMRQYDPVTGKDFKKDYGWFVDISNAGFSSLKLTAIKELYMGRNGKMAVQFNNRFWRQEGNNGETYATAYINNKETQYQNSWETTLGQSGQTGILLNYVSGDKVNNLNNSLTKLWWDPNAPDKSLTTPSSVTNFLTQYNELVPGSLNSQNFTGFQLNNNLNACNPNTSLGCNRYNNVASINWLTNPYSRGSYAGYGPGQSVKFAGIEPVAEPCLASDPIECLDPKYQMIQRNAHFAGEHTSYDFIGYIEGAALSGQRAGNEVRDALKLQNIPTDY